MAWDIVFHPEFERWVDTLPAADEEALAAVLGILSEIGPALGRPLVDSVKGSRHRNLKELRPPSSGSSEIRVLFAFDPARRAILLVGGDKSSNWRGWYDRYVPIADSRYTEHLATIPRRET